MVLTSSSNILVGFLSWIEHQFKGRRKTSNISIPGLTSSISSSSHMPRRPKMSHASLALLLERGRRIGKRVIVASSPTYQPLDDMHDMGYEVSVLQRVAIKEGSGNGSNGSTASLGNDTTATAERPKYNKSQSRRDRVDRRDSLRSSTTTSSSNGLAPGSGTLNSFDGSGGSSTESGTGTSPSVAFMAAHQGTPLGSSSQSQGPPVSMNNNNRRGSHRRFPSAPSVFSPNSLSTISDGFSPFSPESSAGTPQANTPGTTNTATSSNSNRPRYREEAVDELLQLKILQVLIASPAPAPRGSTVVLATGDGASSQFNRDGFLGCVRMAVQRGWRVELVSWEKGRSRAWEGLSAELREEKRRGGSARTHGGLSMIDLDRWGWDVYDSRTST